MVETSAVLCLKGEKSGEGMAIRGIQCPESYGDLRVIDQAVLLGAAADADVRRS